MFGASGGALHRRSIIFLSQSAAASRVQQTHGLQKQVSIVRGCCTVNKQHMVHSDHTPHMEIDAQAYEVRADGVLSTGEPATVLPMAQRFPNSGLTTKTRVQ
jgi:urease subunit alpha